MRGHHRMVSLWNEHQLPVAHRHRLVDAPVRGVHLLHRESLRPLDPVVVNLFEIHLIRRVVHVVLVRRIARPVACRRKYLHHHQPLRQKSGRQHGVDLPRRVSTAANLDPHVRWRHQPRRVLLFSLAVAKSQIARRIRADCKRGPDRQIKRVRQPVKNRLALPDPLPIAPRACHRANAAQHHHRQFSPGRLAPVFPSRLQLPRLKS